MRRRHLIVLAASSIATITGCLGEQGGGQSTAAPDGQDEDTGTNNTGTKCIEEPDVDATIPGNIEQNGVTMKFDTPIIDTSYSEFDQEKLAQQGATFVALPFTAEVTGDTEKTLGGRYMIEAVDYFGVSIENEDTVAETFTVDGKEFKSSSESGASSSLFPGESVTGAYLFQLPENFEPGAAVAQVTPTRDGVANVALGDSSNIEYPCYSNKLPDKPIKVGETVSHRGIEYGISGITTSDSLQVEDSDQSPPDGAKFLILEISVEVVGKHPVRLPDRPDVVYAGESTRPAGVFNRVFTSGGTEYVGFGSRITRNGQMVIGRRIYPGVNFERAVVNILPEDFERGKLQIVKQFFDGETVAWDPTE